MAERHRDVSVNGRMTLGAAVHRWGKPDLAHESPERTKREADGKLGRTPAELVEGTRKPLVKRRGRLVVHDTHGALCKCRGGTETRQISGEPRLRPYDIERDQRVQVLSGLAVDLRLADREQIDSASEALP